MLVNVALALCGGPFTTAWPATDAPRYRVEWRTLVAHGSWVDSTFRVASLEALERGELDPDDYAEYQRRSRMSLVDSMGQLSALIRMTTRDTVAGVVVRIQADSLRLTAVDQPMGTILPEAIRQLMAPRETVEIEFFLAMNGRVVPLPGATGWIRASMLSAVVPLLVPDPAGRLARITRWQDTITVDGTPAGDTLASGAAVVTWQWRTTDTLTAVVGGAVRRDASDLGGLGMSATWQASGERTIVMDPSRQVHSAVETSRIMQRNDFGGPMMSSWRGISSTISVTRLPSQP